MKPSWKDAPEWANYLAQDYCNRWWWFEHKPFGCSVERMWFTPEGEVQAASPSTTNPNFLETLEEKRYED